MRRRISGARFARLAGGISCSAIPDKAPEHPDDFEFHRLPQKKRLRVWPSGRFIFESRNLLDIPAVFPALLTVIVIGLIVGT
jgi:hypothetical protein